MRGAQTSEIEPKIVMERALAECIRKVGVIGLGAMGMGVARSLLRAGLEVHVFDLRNEPLAEIAVAGGQPATSPAALAS